MCISLNVFAVVISLELKFHFDNLLRSLMQTLTLVKTLNLMVSNTKNNSDSASKFCFLVIYINSTG